MDFLLRNDGLIAALAPLWLALAFGRAAVVARPYRRHYVIAALTGLVFAGYAWMIAGMWADGYGGSLLPFSWLIALLIFHAARAVRGEAGGEAVARGLAAIGLAPAPALAEPVPARPLVRRGLVVVVAVFALGAGLFVALRLLQPCAPLDRFFGRSGCFAELSLGLRGSFVGLHISPDGGRILADDRGDALVVADLADGRILQRFAAQGDRFVAAIWSPDGGRIAAVTDRPELVIWDAERGAALWRQPLPAIDYAPVIAWSADGSRLAVGGPPDLLLLLDAQSGAELRRIALEGPAGDVAFSADGASLALVTGGQARRYDLGRAELLPAGVPALSISGYLPDGRLVAYQRDRVMVALPSPEGFAPTVSYPVVPAFRDGVARLAPDGRLLYGYSFLYYEIQRDIVQVLSLEEGAAARSVDLGPPLSALNVDLSADGSLLAVEARGYGGFDERRLLLFRVPPAP